MANAKAETPDEVLVVAAILGDFDAFNELVTRYRAAVVRTAQSVVGAGDAEDVAQEALLLAFKALPSIEDPSRFASWLMTITRHRAFRWNRQERKRRERHVALGLVGQRIADRDQQGRAAGGDQRGMKAAVLGAPAVVDLAWLAGRALRLLGQAMEGCEHVGFPGRVAALDRPAEAQRFGFDPYPEQVVQMVDRHRGNPVPLHLLQHDHRSP